MKKKEIVKTVGKIIVEIGVGAIIGNAVNATTPSNTGTLKKICIVIGTVVLVGIVSDKAVEHFGKQFDSTLLEMKKIVNEG